MNRKNLLCFLLFVFMFVPLNIEAFFIKGFNFFISNELIYQYNNLAEEENQIYELLSITSNIKNWSLGITIRGFNFYKQKPNTTLGKVNFDLYRFYLRYDSIHFKVNMGDFYSLLGRGLVLSVLKNEEILRERTIVGGDFLFHQGRFDLRVLGGVVKDETEEQKWTIAAGEVNFKFLKNNRLGLLFSYIDDIDTRMEIGKRLTYTFSLQGDKILNFFSYYFEAGLLNFYENNAYLEDGSAIYSNITFSHSHVTAFIEYKKYEDFNNEMNNPPVADREDEVSSISDTEGGRLYFQYAFFNPDLRLFLNWGRYREYEDTGNHYYGGMIVEDLWDSLDISFSYGIKDILYPIKKINIDVIYQISSRLSFQASIKNKQYSDGDFTFKEYDHLLQVSLAPSLSLHFMHQYSYNKIMDLNHFWSGGIKVTLKGKTVIELSIGTIRGGQICSGGQCFIIPPFKGVKFSIFHVFK